MISLDRALQRQILEELADEYPNYVDFYLRVSDSENWKYSEDHDAKIFHANLFYLKEHGLIIGTFAGLQRDHERRITRATISHDGLDFLADDGGLSAILKTVTVKFDLDNVRTILEDKIVASHLSPEEKASFLKKVKSLSGEMLKETVLKVFEKGLEHPELWPVLMKSVGL